MDIKRISREDHLTDVCNVEHLVISVELSVDRQTQDCKTKEIVIQQGIVELRIDPPSGIKELLIVVEL